MPIRFRRSAHHLTYARPGADFLRREGERIVSKIVKRTHAGKDENDQPFVPYSGDRGGRVDLTDTGAMTQNLQVTSASTSRIALGFTKVKEGEKAIYHQEGTRAPRVRSSSSGRFLPRGRRPSGQFRSGGSKGLPARPWLGVAKKWIDELVARLMKDIKIK